MKLQAGKRNQRITIRRKSATRDNKGGELISWQDDDPIWAAAEPIRGREYTALNAAQSDIEVRFTILYKAGINTDDRVVWRGDVYELASPPIDVGAKKIDLELMCRTAQS